MSNEITATVNVFYRKDGLVNLYIHHPYESWGSYKEKRNINKRLINWLRVEFPKTLNEFREMPISYTNEYGYLYAHYSDPHFCIYGLTKMEYMRIKLSWIIPKERLLHTKTRKDKKGNIKFLNVKGKKFFSKRHVEPTDVCKLRFARPNFKQKLLKTT